MIELEGGSRFREEAEARIALRTIAERASKQGHDALVATLRRAIDEIDARLERADRELAADRRAPGPCTLVTRHVTVNGERLRIAVERAFWAALDAFADDGLATTDEFCEAALALRAEGAASLSSAVRVLVLQRCASNSNFRAASSGLAELSEPAGR
jgi:predicted DNA-binding ribbon-helix-helix protein